jgi:FMN phosphatase YigB (HAD superfamily)
VASPFQAILDYEVRHGIPPGWVNYSISKSAPEGAWQLLETGKIALDSKFFSRFNEDLHNQARWKDFLHLQQRKATAAKDTSLPVPKVDGEQLFDEMMRYSSRPDPWIFPALQKLKASGDFIVAALSNTVIFPPGHALYSADYFNHPTRSIFDVFISSAHVGLRKPDPAIYHLALRQMNLWAMAHLDTVEGRGKAPWKDGVTAEEVLFLDDIGENLRAAKKIGFRTVKVALGKGFQAVEQLEDVTGLKLANGHSAPSKSGSASSKI